MSRWMRWAIVIVMLAAAAAPALAQDNLLIDPGFEGEIYSFVSADPSASVIYNVPSGWGGGLVSPPGPEPWRNIHPTGFPHTAGIKRSGGRSFHMARGGGTFTAWVYQQVFVQPGADLRGGGFAFIESSSGIVRAGIDPTGGTNPFSPSVIWSPWNGARYTWAEVSVNARAGGGVATLFLFATQDQPSDPNGVYWDDAFLLGAAGAPAAAAPAADPARQYANPTVRLNVRAGAGLDFNRIGAANPGESYPIIALERGWYAIEYGDRRGYVSSAFVDVTQGPAGTVPAPGAGGAPALPPVDGLDFTVDYTRRLRAAPTTTAETLTRIPYQQIIRAVGRTGDGQWLQVVYEGQTGWVSSRLGRVNGDLNRLPVR